MFANLLIVTFTVLFCTNVFIGSSFAGTLTIDHVPGGERSSFNKSPWTHYAPEKTTILGAKEARQSSLPRNKGSGNLVGQGRDSESVDRAKSTSTLAENETLPAGHTGCTINDKSSYGGFMPPSLSLGLPELIEDPNIGRSSPEAYGFYIDISPTGSPHLTRRTGCSQPSRKPKHARAN